MIMRKMIRMMEIKKLMVVGKIKERKESNKEKVESKMMIMKIKMIQLEKIK